MKGYVIDVKERKWVVVLLQNVMSNRTIHVDTQVFYFGSKKAAIEYAERNSGEYLVYIYKRVKTLMPWCQRLADFLFSEM